MKAIAILATLAVVAVAATGSAVLVMNNSGSSLEDNVITITGDTTVTYDGEAVSVPEYTVLGGAETSAAWLDGSGNTIDAPTDAGTYTLRITAAATDGYRETVLDTEFVIEQAENVITVTGSLTSGYASVTVPSYTVLEDAVCTEKWYCGGEEVDTPSDGGTYTLTITAAATANYKETSASFVYTVTDDREENTITVTGSVSKDYDGEAADVPAYTVLGDAECTVKWYSGDTEVSAPTDAGTYTLEITAASTSTYKRTVETVTYTINRISNTLTVTGLVEMSYSGSPVSDPAYTVLGEASCTTSWYTSDGKTQISAPTDAGTYLFRITAAETTNYTETVLDTGYTITQIPNTITVTGSCTAYYTGEAVSVPAYTVLGSASCTVTWYESDGITVISAPSAVGEYKFSVSAAETTNYAATVTYFDLEIVLTPNTITVTSDLTMEYTGETAADPTYTVLGDASCTTGWYASDGTTSISAPSEEGTYIFRISAAATGYYAATVYDAEFVIYVKPTYTFTITCESGTSGCYNIVEDDYGGYTVTFGAVTEDSEYSITGTLNGNIVIDAGDDYEFTLSLSGFTLNAAYNTPVAVLSGDNVSLSAKKGTVNCISDTRDAVDDEDETQYGCAVYSAVDLKLKGKGTLTVTSDNNNGIHCKDDLDVKNLTLNVTCEDNALKGNDSVTITGGTITLISRTGDGIKTSNTELKTKDDGTTKQQGIITINTDDSDLTLTIYAACDGIDASYDVVISGSPVINICTDKYSEYSEEVTETDSDMYLKSRLSSTYSYSLYYYNSSDTSQYVWVNPEYSTYSGNYYVYTFESPSSSYNKLIVYVYGSSQSQGQDSSYAYKSSTLTVNTSYDCIVLSTSRGSVSVSWTSYSSSSSSSSGWGGPGGMGGMQDGNSDKGTYSTKGIKADNSITISGGTVTIEAYDDAIHANSDTLIDYGSTTGYGSGDVTISGGSVSVYSNDDGIHADGTLTISSGTVNVTGSYEGIEGSTITISGGEVYTRSSDDGINASGTITLSGGYVFVYAGGDGIDSNCTTSYQSILFSGATVAVVSTSSGNSAIDTDGGYTYTAGEVLIICPQGMTSECMACKNYSSVGKNSTITVSSGNYLTVSVSGSSVMALKMPCSMSNAFVMYLGSSSASFGSSGSVSGLTQCTEYIYT